METPKFTQCSCIYHLIPKQEFRMLMYARGRVSKVGVMLSFHLMHGSHALKMALSPGLQGEASAPTSNLCFEA